jgi:uncharacterized protein (DUF1778 family)
LKRCVKGLSRVCGFESMPFPLDLYGSLPYIWFMATTYPSKRSERLEARISQEEKKIIEAAAALRGISVTDFLRTTVKDAALQTIRENEVLTLAESSRKIFVEALLNPPKPNESALAAARRFLQEVS